MTERPGAHPPAGGSRWNEGRVPAVGVRVMVRRRLRGGETSHLLTDVLGHVVALSPELVVRRADGEEVTVPERDIEVLKVLPPRTIRARDVRTLEYANALAWPGTEYELVDGWLCRAGEGWSYRRDSAVPVLPWAATDALDGVHDWYTRRGLPLRIADVERLVDLSRLTLGGAPVAADRLTVGRPLHLCTGDAAAIADQHPAEGAEVRLLDRPDDDWLALYHGTAGLHPDEVRPSMRACAALVDGEPAPGGHVVFARLERDGGLAAIARGSVTAGPDGEPRVGVSCVETAPGQRRRGLAEVVTSALAAWGVSLGARQCHLHVFDDNAAGRALWSKTGFDPHHGARYVRVD